MNYNKPPLILTNTSIHDANGSISLDELPEPKPICSVRLSNTTPLMERLWIIALADIESNIIETDTGKYFGAGSDFNATVYTRDISYSGLLGLNLLYPDIMLNSLKHTRILRKELDFTVSEGYAINSIPAPWNEENIPEKEFMNKYNTNSYTRRTDDVIWIVCAGQLLDKRFNTKEHWEWLYNTGKAFFERFYNPFHDTSDGLYYGQASFVDIHFRDHKTTGYPQDWSIEDCIMIKSLSTNCLYTMALQVMTKAALHLGYLEEVQRWEEQQELLTKSIKTKLKHPDGTLSYFKDRHGALQQRREALGLALAVLSGILTKNDAILNLEDYPIDDGGVPLFHPFFNTKKCYHNNSTWPFVDTFFIKALEEIDGIDRTALNASLLARTCIKDGTFHEVTDYRSREIKGSKSQLWSAAAFVDTCYRGGLIKN